MARIDFGDGGYGQDQGPTFNAPAQTARFDTSTPPTSAAPGSAMPYVPPAGGTLGGAPGQINYAPGVLPSIPTTSGSPASGTYTPPASAFADPTRNQNVPLGGSLGGGKQSGESDAAYLQRLIRSGMSPQQAAQTFNQTLGRTTGNEAVYYDPSKHGGHATIGLPEGYLSDENGWGFTPRGPETNGGANPGGYDDPSSVLFLNQLMQRLNQANQPQNTDIIKQLTQLAQARIQSLNAPPYSAADEAALITKYRDPLTQARDAAKQQKALDLSRRGITPDSGVFQQEMAKIDQAYVGGIAQGANQMGVNAVAQKNANADEQLQILNALLGATNTQTDRTNAQADQALALAKMFPDFDAQRLNQLLVASGEQPSASSLISGLTGLGNLNLNSTAFQSSQDAANASAWAKIIASIPGLF